MNSPFAISHLPFKPSPRSRQGSELARHAPLSNMQKHPGDELFACEHYRLPQLQHRLWLSQVAPAPNSTPHSLPNEARSRFGPRSQRESLILSHGLIGISMISLVGRNLSQSAVLGLGFCQRMLRLLQVRTKLSHTLCQLLHLEGRMDCAPGTE